MRAAAPTRMAAKLHYWPGPGGMQEYIRDQARVKSIVPGEVRATLSILSVFPVAASEEGSSTALDARCSIVQC